MALRRNVDMVDGKLLPNILLYALPLIATGLLQLLYNAADMIVVARWAGGTALAAVGSNGPLVNLIINVFLGLSVGASVAVSQYYGAGDHKGVHQVVHTAMAISAVSGVFTMIVGVLISRQALVWMDTPADVIDQATLYLRIYFLGMPAAMVYNFGAAILRAVGDTKRPLYILALSGVINVVLNLVLVIVFHLGVAGVAIATTVSQIVSAVLVVLCLVRSHGSYHFAFRALRIYKDKLLLMMRHGIPAGLQSTVFSASNLIIQSSINSFGAAAMAGSSAAANLEGLVYIAMNAMHHTCLAFTGQNVGARRPDRLGRVFWTCMGLVTVIGLVMGMLVWLFGEPLLMLYTATGGADMTVPPEEIVRNGMVRLSIISTTYFLCGIMEVLVGAMRGMGSPWAPMVVSILGVCGVRIAWIFTVFTFLFHSLESLYLSYTVSWLFTAAVHFICYLRVRKRTVRRLQEEIPI